MTSYEYKQISPSEILDNELGPFNHTHRDLPQRKRIQELMKNRQAINDWMEKVGKKGWKLATSYEYESVPYGGTFVFVREKGKYDDDVELLPSIDQQIDAFEEETGKKAIWKNDFTKSFKEWLEDNVPKKTLQEEEKETQ